VPESAKKLIKALLSAQGMQQKRRKEKREKKGAGALA